jgi:hypothetical protein
MRSLAIKTLREGARTDWISDGEIFVTDFRMSL